MDDSTEWAAAVVYQHTEGARYNPDFVYRELEIARAPDELYELYGLYNMLEMYENSAEAKRLDYLMNKWFTDEITRIKIF